MKIPPLTCGTIQIIDPPHPRRPLHQCEINFVGLGLPSQLQDGSLQPGMCTPVAPAREHPIGRTALQVRPPFPFEDCFQYSFVSAIVRIPTQPIYQRYAWKLRAREILKHDKHLEEDAKMRGELLAEAASSSGLATQPRLGSEAGYLGLGIPHLASSSALSLVSTTQYTESTNGSVLTFNIGYINNLVQDPDLLPVVDVSIGLTELTEVVDPSGFLEEEATLVKCASFCLAEHNLT